jgi:hypothetical protein
MEAHHVDLVRVDNFRPLDNLLGAFRGTRSELNRFVGAPYPARAGPRRVRAGALVCGSRSHRSRMCGGGRVGISTEFPGCSGGRPRLGGTHDRDENVAAGCPRTGGGPVSALDCHAGVQDLRSRDIAAIFDRHVPVLVITRPRGVLISNCLSLWSSLRGRNGPQPVRGTRQERARPQQACPQAGDSRQRNPGGPVVLPTQPPRRAWGRAGRWTARKARTCTRTASGAGRERRAKPQLDDQVDTLDQARVDRSQVRYSRRLRVREGWRSLAMVLASICRIRSRVTP